MGRSMVRPSGIEVVLSPAEIGRILFWVNGDCAAWGRMKRDEKREAVRAAHPSYAPPLTDAAADASIAAVNAFCRVTDLPDEVPVIAAPFDARLALATQGIRSAADYCSYSDAVRLQIATAELQQRPRSDMTATDVRRAIDALCGASSSSGPFDALSALRAQGIDSAEAYCRLNDTYKDLLASRELAAHPRSDMNAVAVRRAFDDLCRVQPADEPPPQSTAPRGEPTAEEDRANPSNRQPPQDPSRSPPQDSSDPWYRPPAQTRPPAQDQPVPSPRLPTTDADADKAAADHGRPPASQQNGQRPDDGTPWGLIIAGLAVAGGAYVATRPNSPRSNPTESHGAMLGNVGRMIRNNPIKSSVVGAGALLLGARLLRPAACEPGTVGSLLGYGGVGLAVFAGVQAGQAIAGKSVGSLLSGK